MAISVNFRFTLAGQRELRVALGKGLYWTSESGGETPPSVLRQLFHVCRSPPDSERERDICMWDSAPDISWFPPCLEG